MKTIFIVQPMRGRSHEDLMAERRKVVRILLGKFGPVNVLDTLFTHQVGHGTPLEYLGEGIKYLSEAELAVFVPGWDKARGCKVERLCCEEYGIEILDLEEV